MFHFLKHQSSSALAQYKSITGFIKWTGSCFIFSIVGGQGMHSIETTDTGLTNTCFRTSGNKSRGANIYAELVGGGMSADAYHLTAPHPEGLGASLVMRNALEDAHMKPEELDYINVHGTATPLGDISESKAIIKVFGEHAYKLNISSTKSMTGHLLGAAGAIEAIAAILATKYDIIPPTINFSNPDDEIDQKLDLTFNKAQKRTSMQP